MVTHFWLGAKRLDAVTPENIPLGRVDLECFSLYQIDRSETSRTTPGKWNGIWKLTSIL